MAFGPPPPSSPPAFGFTASLLEQLPIIGLAFSVSNRIGSAMWAFDLEKRQHRFANGELKPLSPGETGLGAGVQKLEFGDGDRDGDGDGIR
jgi:hypothetical protein